MNHYVIKDVSEIYAGTARYVSAANPTGFEYTPELSKAQSFSSISDALAALFARVLVAQYNCGHNFTIIKVIAEKVTTLKYMEQAL